MTSIQVKRINGYGPYAYKVEWENGQQHWEYLGRASNVDVDSAADTYQQDETNDEEEDEQLTDEEIEESKWIDNAVKYHDFNNTEEGDVIEIPAEAHPDMDEDATVEVLDVEKGKRPEELTRPAMDEVEMRLKPVEGDARPFLSGTLGDLRGNYESDEEYTATVVTGTDEKTVP